MSSPFAHATASLEIPFDPPHTVTVQQLNGRQLGKAKQVFFNNLIAEVQVRGGAKVQKDVETLFQVDAADVTAEVEKLKSDPLNGFDKYTLLYDGIKGWSYPQSLERVPVAELTSDGRAITVMRVPAIDALSDEAVDFFATEIMRLTKPSLFQTKEEAKAAQREADGVSSIAG